MPDISMCGHETCVVRYNCYRHPRSGTKPSDTWQTWGLFEPGGDGRCSSYWPLTDADLWPLADEIETPATQEANHAEG